MLNCGSGIGSRIMGSPSGRIFTRCMSTNPGTDLCNSKRVGGWTEGATGGRPIVSIGGKGLVSSGIISIFGPSGIGNGPTTSGRGTTSSIITSGISSGEG